MSDSAALPTAAEQDAAAPIDWRTLEAPVHFDLGDAAATLGELESLHPGRIFELAAGLDDPVRISVNGALIARGSLVQIGAKLGVRVTEVLADAHGNA